MSVKIVVDRYFEVAHASPAVSNFYVNESIVWMAVGDEDTRGVTLPGETGKYIWIQGTSLVNLLPDISDPTYWDYYNLPVNPIYTIVQEITQSEYETIMEARIAELAALKSGS